MDERLNYKGKDYRVDEKGNIYEDKVFGPEVGKKDKDGKITIQTGILKKEEGHITKSGDIYEKGIFGEYKEKVGEKKNNCLLSSACVAARCLPDDCDELTTLRKFRRDHLEGTPRGEVILKEYYNIGGKILQWLNLSSERKVLFDDLYQRLVIGTVDLIRANKIESALDHYTSVVREYQTKARI